MSKPIQLLRIAGLLTCLMSAVSSVAELVYNKSPQRAFGCLAEIMAVRSGWPQPAVAILEVVGLSLFAAALYLATREHEVYWPRPRNVLLLAAQSVLAVAIAPELLLLVSGQVALLLPIGRGLVWLVAQSVLQIGTLHVHTILTGDNPLLHLMGVQPAQMGLAMVEISAVAVVWHFLAFCLGYLAAVESRQARELARANAELRAARQFETDSVRLAERLHLSRELHDASGHHLAALSVNLRLMRRLSHSEQVQGMLEESLLVVRDLLRDVRAVVRDLRDVQGVDLKKAIETMAQGVPGLTVHLALDFDVTAAEPYHSHALFRCSQEILTNTVKHARARNLWLTISAHPGSFRLEARDDGRGCGQFAFGNGLSGMRERVTELGGSMQVESRAGDGFQIALELPVRGRAA